MTNSNITSTNFSANVIANGANNKSLNSMAKPAMAFQTKFAGIMEMYSDRVTVAEYLKDHQVWFSQCAEPMKVQAFGDDGYTLSIGNYGAFGYHLEPQMSVMLETSDGDTKYKMYSVTNSQYEANYDVNYCSVMDLHAIPTTDAVTKVSKIYRQEGIKNVPSEITKIDWTLSLSVNIRFPNFIYKLPQSVIKSTGNRVLSQIVKQISPRLSYKVQKDFHDRHRLPIPPAKSRTCKPA